MSAGKIKLKLSKPTAECIRPDAPKEMRLLAAEGRLPVEPKESLTALYYLSNDKDPDVKAEAKKSLRNFPVSLLKPILSSAEVHPRIIDCISRLHPDDASLIELIVKNDSTESGTMEKIAENADAEILDLIVGQLERIRGNPGILEAVRKNPSASADLLEKIGFAIQGTDPEETEEDSGEEREEDSGEA